MHLDSAQLLLHETFKGGMRFYIIGEATAKVKGSNTDITTRNN